MDSRKECGDISADITVSLEMLDKIADEFNYNRGRGVEVCVDLLEGLIDASGYAGLDVETLVLNLKTLCEAMRAKSGIRLGLGMRPHAGDYIQVVTRIR